MQNIAVYNDLINQTTFSWVAPSWKPSLIGPYSISNSDASGGSFFVVGFGRRLLIPANIHELSSNLHQARRFANFILHGLPLVQLSHVVGTITGTWQGVAILKYAVNAVNTK
jgi:hypothetical protein